MLDWTRKKDRQTLDDLKVTSEKSQNHPNIVYLQALQISL